MRGKRPGRRLRQRVLGKREGGVEKEGAKKGRGIGHRVQRGETRAIDLCGGKRGRIKELRDGQGGKLQRVQRLKEKPN